MRVSTKFKNRLTNFSTLFYWQFSCMQGGFLSLQRNDGKRIALLIHLSPVKLHETQLPVKSPCAGILLVHIDKYRPVVPYRHVNQLFADSFTQVLGRNEQHLNLLILYADKGCRGIGIEDYIKMPDACQPFRHAWLQILNIRLLQEMMSGTHGRFPQCCQPVQKTIVPF